MHVDPALGVEGRAWRSFLTDVVASSTHVTSVGVRRGRLHGKNGDCAVEGDGDGRCAIAITIADDLPAPEIARLLKHEIAHACHVAAAGAGWPLIAVRRDEAEHFARACEGRLYPAVLASGFLDECPEVRDGG